MKGLRVAGAGTIEAANAYLEKEYLPWWNRTLVVKPADAADAHRPLGQEYDLAAILSHVEQRQVTNDYTVRYEGKIYQIDRKDIRAGLRKAKVRVEQRLDGTIAVQFQGRYMSVRRCELPVREFAPIKTTGTKPACATGKPKSKSAWMKNFSVGDGPSIRRAIKVSNACS